MEPFVLFCVSQQHYSKRLHREYILNRR